MKVDEINSFRKVFISVNDKKIMEFYCWSYQGGIKEIFSNLVGLDAEIALGVGLIFSVAWENGGYNSRHFGPHFFKCDVSAVGL